MDLYIENIDIADRYDSSGIKLTSDDVPDIGDSITKPNVLLVRGDSLSIAKWVIDSCNDVPCVLNFANNDHAGGGYSLKGSTQEEILLKMTTLGVTLKPEYYPLDIMIDKYQYWDYKKLTLVYSPEVYVLRNSEYELITTPYKVSIITCAAICNPRTAGRGYMWESDRRVTRRKIQMILDTAILRGHKILIAGQWGCGAFGNPLEICDIWVEEIAKRKIKVIFPIFDNAFNDTMSELLLKYQQNQK